MTGQYTHVEPPSIESISVDVESDEIAFQYDVSDQGTELAEVGFYLHTGSMIVALGCATVEGRREQGTLTVISDDGPDRYRFYVANDDDNRTYAYGDLEDEP